MVNESVVRTTVGIIGNVISVGLFLSPAPTFYGMIKKKSVEEFKANPYLATLANCAFWVFYGMPFVHPDSILVLTINGVGLVIELIFLTTFFIFAPLRERIKILICLLIEVVFLAIIVLITMLLFHDTTKRSLVVGIICAIFNILMYASPLTVMAKVIKTKSVRYMPFWLSLANLLNGLAWTIYACFHPFDIYVLVCNSIGIASGVVQLTLYACYCGKRGEKDKAKDNHDHRLNPNEIQLPVSEGGNASHL